VVSHHGSSVVSVDGARPEHRHVFGSSRRKIYVLGDLARTSAACEVALL
jgi:hypothetical protein